MLPSEYPRGVHKKYTSQMAADIGRGYIKSGNTDKKYF